MRKLFHCPEHLAYYNAAHMGLLPRSALPAGVHGMERRASPWEPSGADRQAEEARACFAALLNAPVDTIALLPSTSYAMALATRLFPLRREGVLLLLEDEHPSQVMIWRREASDIACGVRTVRRPDDGDWTRAILSAIDAEVQLACLPQVHWLDGASIDLVAVGRALRAAGARLVVDATQSIGARHFDITAIQPDFVAVSGYKWLLGPMGVGYAYVASHHHNAIPIEDGFGPRAPLNGWFDDAAHVRYPEDWKPGAQKFDAGGAINPIQLALALEGLKTIRELGVANIENELCRRNRALIAAHPAAPFSRSPEPSHIVSLRIDRPEDVRQAMEAIGVSASLRGPYLRLSGHLWNDEADRARLAILLRQLFG